MAREDISNNRVRWEGGTAAPVSQILRVKRGNQSDTESALGSKFNPASHEAKRLGILSAERSTSNAYGLYSSITRADADRAPDAHRSLHLHAQISNDPIFQPANHGKIEIGPTDTLRSYADHVQSASEVT
jgi:hypothetical protein